MRYTARNIKETTKSVNDREMRSRYCYLQSDLWISILDLEVYLQLSSG